MKFSAKTTTITFLAGSVLGAASLAGGCTVNSTSNTDTDGGTSTSSSGSSSGGSSGTPATDSGTDATAAACTDNTKQTAKFPAGCQTCMESKCCDKLKGCFNQTPESPN